MRKYELVLVLDGKATAAKKKSLSDKIAKLIKELGGRVGKVDEWGKKDLAYKIGKSETGEFLFFPLELDGQSAKGIDAKLKQESGIIRYLFVRKD